MCIRDSIAPERWHAYVLYCLAENMQDDFQSINHFLDKTLSPAKSLRWMKLDNAAKIYPAAKRRTWTNYFRLSATLTEPIDLPILRAALDVTVRDVYKRQLHKRAQKSALLAAFRRPQRPAAVASFRGRG